MTPQDDTRPTPPSLGDRPTRPRPEGTSTEAPDPAATVVTDPTTLPAVVPGFEMGGELGRGAMGVVYEATQPGLNRPVAVKMFLGEAAEDGLDVVPRHAGRHPGRSDVGRRHSGVRVGRAGGVRIEAKGRAGQGEAQIVRNSG